LEIAAWNKVICIDSSDARKTDAAISKMFAEALASQPSLIAIDDLESLAGRKSESGQFTYALARELQKLAGSRVQVVASTKRLNDVDEQVLKRFKIHIELPIPTSKDRLEILQYYTVNAPLDVLHIVAERTHAFTAEDIETLCQTAYEAADERTNREGNANGSNDLQV
jgi:AAA family ATPase